MDNSLPLYTDALKSQRTEIYDLGSLVMQWAGHQTCDQEVTGLTQRLTVRAWLYNFGMLFTPTHSVPGAKQ